MKFHLNGYSFWQIFVADSFGFALLFTFYCSIVVTQCLAEMNMCYSVKCDIFNHMYVISMFSFMNRENTPTDIHLLEVLSCVRVLSAILLHLLKILRLLAVKSSRIVVQRLEEVFCDMEESMVSVL